MTKKTYFNWSTGKDSALALFHLSKDKDFSVECLVTSVNATHDRVSMHGVRRELLHMQTNALGIPATTVEIPEMLDKAEYESRMHSIVKDLKADGFVCGAFGDIFLEDLRRYREEKLASQGISTCFPLWGRDTSELMREFLDLGFKAITVCVSSEKLGREFLGRVIDEEFLAELPFGVDPCGENGEFHTFCYAGPVFKNEIKFEIGEKIFREYRIIVKDSNKSIGTDSECTPETNTGFWFCDLIPT